MASKQGHELSQRSQSPSKSHQRPSVTSNRSSLAMSESISLQDRQGAMLNLEITEITPDTITTVQRVGTDPCLRNPAPVGLSASLGQTQLGESRSTPSASKVGMAKAAAVAAGVGKPAQPTFKHLPELPHALEEAYRHLQVKYESEKQANDELYNEVQRYRSQQQHSRWYPSRTGEREANQIHQLKDELRKAKANEDIMKQGIFTLKEQNWELQKQVNMINADVQLAQERSFLRMTDARWTPVPDRVFIESLKDLYSAIRSWAKKWAVEAISVNTLHDRAFLDYMSRVVQLNSKGGLPTEFASPSSKFGPKVPSLLLSALLAHEVHSHILSRPFFFIENDPKDLEPKRSIVLGEIYDMLIKANPQEGHTWRSQLVRILNPPQSREASPRDEETSRTVAKHIATLCENTLPKAFKEGQAGQLMYQLEKNSERGKERSKGLREIFSIAATLSISLWTQRSYLFCQGLKELQAINLQSPAASTFMEAHVLHMKMHNFEDEDPRQGKGVRLVVHPSVLAYGNNEGEGYDQEPRVLARATVWLEV